MGSWHVQQGQEEICSPQVGYRACLDPARLCNSRVALPAEILSHFYGGNDLSIAWVGRQRGPGSRCLQVPLLVEQMQSLKNTKVLLGTDELHPVLYVLGLILAKIIMGFFQNEKKCWNYCI